VIFTSTLSNSLCSLGDEMGIITLLSKVVLAIYYCKSAVRKTSQIYQYYNTIVEYGILSRYATHFSVLLITLEYMTAIALIFSYYEELYLITGGLLQLIYLMIQILSSGKSLSISCNCFDHALPQTITLRSIMVHLILLFSLVVLYGIAIRT